MKKNHKGIKLVMFLLTLSLLVACSNGGKEPTNNPNSGGQGNSEKVTIRVMQFKGELAETMVEMANAYNAEHPGIKLEIETVNADQYQTALKTRFAGGEEPDIINVEGYSQKDLWLDHMEDLSDQPWVSKMSPITIEGIQDEGKIYGLPLQLEGIGIVYNTRLFDEAGITNPPRTLSEFSDALAKLSDANIPAIANELFSSYSFGVFVVNIGVARQPDVSAFIEGLNNGTETFAGNAIFEEWLDFVDLIYANSYKNPLQVDFSSQISDFSNEEVAMLITGNGPKAMMDAINPDLPSSIFPIPMNEDAEGNDVYYAGANSYWAINKNSKVKEEAKEFFNWLISSPTGQHYVADVFQFIPGVIGLPVNEEAIGNIGVGLNNYIQSDKLLGLEYPRYPAGATHELGTAGQKYFAGQLTREELLQSFDEIWQRLIAEQ